MTLEQLDLFRMEVARHSFNSFDFTHKNIKYDEKAMESWKQEGNTYTLTFPIKEYDPKKNTEKEDRVIFYVDFKDNDFHLSNEEGGLQACVESSGKRIGSLNEKFNDLIENVYKTIDMKYLDEVSKDIVLPSKETFKIKF